VHGLPGLPGRLQAVEPLPSEKSEQRGTHQNPPDLTWATWNLIRFTEVSNKEGALKWLFRRDACLHCTDPGCQRACPVPGCITKTPIGSVVIDQNLCIGCKMCVNACPFEIPGSMTRPTGPTSAPCVGTAPPGA